jgi:cytochrome c oxidase subunit 3
MNTAIHVRGRGSIEPPGSDQDPFRSEGGRDGAIRRGTLVLIAVLAALFLLFGAAYYMRMQHGDWQPLPEPRLLWLNTLLLGIASLLLQGAVPAWRALRWRRTALLVHGAGLCGLAFLLGQLWVWRLISGTGYFSPDNPATAFFYLLTAVHALHLLAGLLVMGRVSYGLVCGAGQAVLQRRVELCTLYWHFLLLVWLLMLALFLMT